MSDMTNARSASEPAPRRVLILSLAPFRYATRTRKAAIAYRESSQVVFLGLQGVGRTAKWDTAGTANVDGVVVKQVPVRRPSAEPGLMYQASNVIRSYVPGFCRLMYSALRTPAAVVHVTGAPLALVGLLHKRRHASVLVLDINERPASVSSAGSLFAVFRRFEPMILRAAASRADITTVVTPGHAEILESEYSFADVLVLRNAPLTSWRAPFRAPGDMVTATLNVTTVGTIFEGRAIERLINAVALARDSGVTVHLRIYGSGRKSYLDALTALVERLRLVHLVSFQGHLNSSDVSAAYLGGHVGLALYEQGDPGNDSLSNKLLECVSTGRPVLAGDLPENRRFIDKHKVGWLTPVTAEGISKAFVEISRHASSLEFLALSCRRLGDEQLTWETDFAQVIAAIESVSRRELAGA